MWVLRMPLAMVWWGLGVRFLVRGIVSTCDIDRLCLLGFDMDVNDIGFHLIVMQLLEDTSLSTRDIG